MAENDGPKETVECSRRIGTEKISLSDASLDLCMVIEAWSGSGCVGCILEDMSKPQLIRVLEMATAMLLGAGFNTETFRTWVLDKIAKGDDQYV